MKLCLLTSTSRRHAYLARRLAETFDLRLIIREKKGLERTYEGHPDRTIINDHFKRLSDVEEDFFPEDSWERAYGRRIDVERGRLSTEDVRAEISAVAPDAVVVFGCGLIKPPVLGVVPTERMLNIHQGLSPYYRGSGTNFWPFVERRPQFIGVTLHTIDAGTDTGGIVAHGRPELCSEDGVHLLGLKTVVVSADLVHQALKLIAAQKPLVPIPQWPGGRVFMRKHLDGTAIRELRRLEEGGFLASWLVDRSAGLTDCVRLVRLET